MYQGFEPYRPSGFCPKERPTKEIGTSCALEIGRAMSMVSWWKNTLSQGVIGTQYALEIEERREVYELAKC